jgi:hypothetical protein
VGTSHRIEVIVNGERRACQTAGYRKHMAGVLLRRGVAEAFQRAAAWPGGWRG